MNELQWHKWCLDVKERLENIEKTLASYHKIQKRMLYVLAIGIVGVCSSGLLLYYN